MSTQIHADGIQTVVHTSKFATDRQADFLRRSGANATTIEFFYAGTAKSEQAEHQREHDRIVYCQTIGLPA